MNFRSVSGTVRCHPQFGMVRDKNGKIGPCILLFSWDENTCQSESGKEHTRRKVQKRIRKLHSVQGCGFPCKVVMDSVSLLARFFGTDESLSPRIQARLEDSFASFVSILISDGGNPSRECTLGGLIRVGSRIYGLTVAHPFSGIADRASVDSPPSLASHDAEDTSTDDSDSVMSDSDQSLFDAFESISAVGTGHEDSHRDRTSEQNANSKLTIRDTVSSQRKPLRSSNARNRSAFGRVCATNSPRGEGEERYRDLDWALIELDSSTQLLPNSYKSPSSATPTSLKAVRSETLVPNSKVVILGGMTGLQDGVIGQGNIDLRISGRRLLVTEVVLSQNLGRSLFLRVGPPPFLADLWMQSPATLALGWCRMKI